MKSASRRTASKPKSSSPAFAFQTSRGVDRSDGSFPDILVSKASPQLEGVIIGRLAGFTDADEPLVDFSTGSEKLSVKARSLVALDDTNVGREVALLFEAKDVGRPVIIGMLQKPSFSAKAKKPVSDAAGLAGEQLVLSAEKEVVLRCGEASITLTRAGKILIRGAYVLSRSSGVNRIKGASVQIN